jgi:CheY-like chemotaxis protein
MFKVILPAEARLAKIAVPKADQRPGLEPDISLGEGRRALVVDDVHTNRIVGSALLKSLGFEVVEADGGEAALAALEKNTCDIIFMDLHLPGMAGDACVERIRASEDLHALVPIIMLTADVSGDARKRTQACGADDICSKPFAMDKVRSIIGRYLPIRSEADSKAG